MVGALPELHEDVLEPHLLHFAGAVDDVDVFHEDLGVPLTLHLGQAHVHVDLLLGKQRLFHVRLQTTEQKRPVEGEEDITIYSLWQCSPTLKKDSQTLRNACNPGWIFLTFHLNS